MEITDDGIFCPLVPQSIACLFRLFPFCLHYTELDWAEESPPL